MCQKKSDGGRRCIKHLSPAISDGFANAYTELMRAKPSVYLAGGETTAFADARDNCLTEARAAGVDPDLAEALEEVISHTAVAEVRRAAASATSGTSRVTLTREALLAKSLAHFATRKVQALITHIGPVNHERLAVSVYSDDVAARQRSTGVNFHFENTLLQTRARTDADVYHAVNKYCGVHNGDGVEVLRDTRWSNPRIAAAAITRYGTPTGASAAGTLFPGLVNTGMSPDAAIKALRAGGWNNQQILHAVERAESWLNPLAAPARNLVIAESVKHPGFRIDLTANSDTCLYLTAIEARTGQSRGTGEGTTIMRSLAQFADNNGLTIELEPSSELGGDMARLKRWYTNLGYQRVPGNLGTWRRTPQAS